MDNLLIRQISSDLNINRYQNESIEEYGNRLIYSALAAWARTLVLGKSYTDLSDETENIYGDCHNVDIMHIQVRLSQIAHGMLMAIPHCEDWVVNSTIEESSSILASQIIENLIFCYELSQLNEIRRLANSPIRNANFKNNKLVLGGEQWKSVDNTMFSVGLGRWVQSGEPCENYKEIFNLPNCTCDEYYNELLDSAFWKENNLDGQYKIFKVGTGLFYNKAWQDFNASKILQGISLLKNTEVDGGYLLVKTVESKAFTAKLDKWYYDEKEIYRIMYSLDRHNGTPAVFKTKIYDDYVLLHCHSRLPSSEMRILLMSSWPKRYCDDIYYRIVPRFVWNEVKNILTNLGIEIR